MFRAVRGLWVAGPSVLRAWRDSHCLAVGFVRIYCAMEIGTNSRNDSSPGARLEGRKAESSVPLSEFPFLTAALEDYALALRLAGDTEGNGRQAAKMRQAVCFMHDALEFLFYEGLLAR